MSLRYLYQHADVSHEIIPLILLLSILKGVCSWFHCSQFSNLKYMLIWYSEIRWRHSWGNLFHVTILSSKFSMASPLDIAINLLMSIMTSLLWFRYSQFSILNSQGHPPLMLRSIWRRHSFVRIRAPHMASQDTWYLRRTALRNVTIRGYSCYRTTSGLGLMNLFFARVNNTSK